MATIRAKNYAEDYLDFKESNPVENIRLGVLNAPGVTDVLDCRTCQEGVSIQLVIRSIDESVTGALEGSQDEKNWYEIIRGTYINEGAYSIEHTVKENYLRYRFVSEEGRDGCAITVDAFPHHIG